ncbi:hypothetical protein QBC46DRAFT_263028 [Diplogelasinospora grovesii]|uniref:Methyltransferase type 11 domain-containing protein n=1 Tax=Diplogelasinospora grovesii TaxID=303347 RepID=A0AAN6N8A9_9PEZI|nr:hypothetical protein QBC46DRAFT_263028 [Diplogelasinospora grovesii]
MAALRSRSGSSGRSGDTGSRNTATYTEPSREEASSGQSLRTRRGVEVNRQPARTIPQPKMSSSRLPQNTAQRRPSYGQTDQQSPQQSNNLSQPWGFLGSGSSARTAPNAQISSSALPSSRLPAAAGPSKPRNVLRRKNSGLGQEPLTSNRNDSRQGSASSSSHHRSQSSIDAVASFDFDRELTASPADHRAGQQAEVSNRTTGHAVRIYPELDRYRDVKAPARDESPGFETPYRIATYDLPPPTPLFSGTSSQISGFSGSPSTRWSGSPGPGPYSRDTTPTSISSQSPGLVAPMRIPAAPGARIRQAADPTQTRPPVTRRRAGSIPNEGPSISAADSHGLAAVRESLTSSSSNSTVRDTDRKESKDGKKKKKGLSPLPPSPPPRKSSSKKLNSRIRDEDESPSKPAREPAQPLMTSPPAAKATSYSRPQPVPTGLPVASPKATPPTRPSRDGIPDLQSQLGLSFPVIHSNLSATSLSERRQSNLLAPAPVGHRSNLSSSSLRPPVGREATPAPRSATLPVSEGMSTSSKPETKRTARTPSPSVSTFKTRFPIFGRRTKPTVPEATQPEKSEKPPVRKGPAAGTGHEGYGRLGAVRRRSGGGAPSTGRGIPGTMSSQESLGNTVTDTFLAERMAPVVIAGGEIVENRNTSAELSRTESNQSFSYGRRPSIESKSSSQLSLASRETPRHTLWPSPFPRDPSQAPSIASSRRPSDSSDSEALAMRSTLALRRSMQRLKTGEKDPPRIPKPIVTRPQVISPTSITSLDASTVMSDDSMFDPPHTMDSFRAGKEAESAPSLTAPKKLMKRARSPRKWNIFGRSQSQPAAVDKKADTERAVVAAVKVVEKKPVAFYTMMDSSEQEDGDTPDLDEVLREAKGLTDPQPQPQPEPEPEPEPEPRPQPQPQAESSIRPRRPSTAPAPVPVPVPASAVEQAPASTLAAVRQATGRPSRLPQVGRIPKVVSARAEQISPKSFSRPFHRISMHLPPPAVDAQDTDFVAKGPSPPKPSTPELTQDESTTTSGTTYVSASRYSLSRDDFLLDPTRPGGQEFLSFSPRKNSACTITTTTTTSSSSGLLTFADATAVIPDANTPLAEDEVWDEYDDLLGDETLKVPPSEGSSQEKPFDLERYTSPAARQIEPPLESPTITTHPPVKSLSEMLQVLKPNPASSLYSQDMTEQIKNAASDLSAEPGPDMGTMAVSDLSSSAAASRSSSAASATGSSRNRAGGVLRHSNASVSSSSQHTSSSSSSEDSNSSPLSQVNLRVASMTVSKWLTFGHVLFSPVRDGLIDMVGSLKRHSILVIDGLGNDDWSFYAAETYPAATFFNLSPRAPLPTTTSDHQQNSSAFPLSPPNHHQIQYPSRSEKFPFGPGSFTCVVFRFPVAGPEAQYRNIISEARRVLKPGGFIELAILDVDLNNMGNRGRRAVRRLKERIHARAPDTSLGSTSDLILRLLGRRGFTDIKTCRVGVPVASAIAHGGGGGGSGSNESGTGTGANVTRSSTTTEGGSGSGRKKDDRSLAEMINDESSVADESITKMVAKVGRWWYSRCYESGTAGPTLMNGQKGSSVWNDKALLAECQEWGTSLKLMVCHARVPEDRRARVASI